MLRRLLPSFALLALTSGVPVETYEVHDCECSPVEGGTYHWAFYTFPDHSLDKIAAMKTFATWDGTGDYAQGVWHRIGTVRIADNGHDVAAYCGERTGYPKYVRFIIQP